MVAIAGVVDVDVLITPFGLEPIRVGLPAVLPVNARLIVVDAATVHS